MPNLFLSGLLLALALSAQADDKIFVLTPAVLDPDATSNETIKRECIDEMKVAPPMQYGQSASPPPAPDLPAVEPGVAAQAAWFLSKKVTVEEITDLAKAGSARVLRLTIVDIEGRGGGIFTGRKGMTVTAELLQNGKVLKVADFTRRSTVAPLTDAGDTCQYFVRISSAIGKDVADWVTARPARTTAGKSSSPVSAPAAVPADADSPSARRLKELQLLLDRGLITTDEYQEKRKAILKDL